MYANLPHLPITLLNDIPRRTPLFQAQFNRSKVRGF
jgi:hypothetical protein